MPESLPSGERESGCFAPSNWLNVNFCNMVDMRSRLTYTFFKPAEKKEAYDSHIDVVLPGRELVDG